MKKFTVIIFCILVLLHQVLCRKHGNRMRHVLPRHLDHWLPRRAAHIFPRDLGNFMNSNMNDYVDKVVTSLDSRLGKMGYDPMPLPDEVREFSVKDLMGFEWHGKLGLHNGTLADLATMKRDGDVIISYNKTNPVVDVTMKFDDLTLVYKYDALIMNIGPQGTIEAIVSGLRINVILEADLKTMKMKLKELHLLDASKIKVHTKGLYLADYVVDGIADSITFLAQKVILKLVEQRVREEAHKVVESIDLKQYIG
ncbi:uncharacterized protein [Anabrus simplex]|uniref:uncharacterized protein n=1 Tax=Anabrus simplex TaxID=316456 RepID=UPI0035A3C86C